MKPLFPFDYLAYAKFNDQFTVYNERKELYVWDGEEGGETKVADLPDMKRCVDFTIMNGFNGESFAKLFVFLNPHTWEDVIADDCSIHCRIGYLWCPKQEEMVHNELIEFPKDLVKTILEFVRGE